MTDQPTSPPPPPSEGAPAHDQSSTHPAFDTGAGFAPLSLEAVAQALTHLRVRVDQGQTREEAADAAGQVVQRALQLAAALPVQTGGPLAGPRLRVLVPDGARVVDVVSLVAWLAQELELVLGPPSTLRVPQHLRHFFVEQPGPDAAPRG